MAMPETSRQFTREEIEKALASLDCGKAITEELAQLRKAAQDGFAMACQSQDKAITEELERLRADKERLDWLDKQGGDVDKLGQNESGDIYAISITFQYPQITMDGSETLRESIDAARAITPPKPEYHPNLDGPAEPIGLSMDADGNPTPPKP